MNIRPFCRDDDDELWAILEPVIRVGETYALPRDMTRDAALAYWTSPDKLVFVTEDDGRIAGTYYLRANQSGGGDHVGNCGYMVAPHATGRGVGRALCAHSIEQARQAGFSALQFNFVVSTNAGAVHLWQSLGFDIVGRLPKVFRHPRLGRVDALVMFKNL